LTGLILTYPVDTAAVTTPLVRPADTPVVFLIAILRTSPPDEAALRAVIADNRRRCDHIVRWVARVTTSGRSR
jgi:hypothetical protein